MMDGVETVEVTLAPSGPACRLADCPPGPFAYKGALGFKTEYGAMETVGPTNVSGSEIRWTVGRYPDAYCLDTGEHFCGGAANKDARAALIVQPLASRAPAPDALAEGRNPMVDPEINWLVHQLEAWPTRVDPERTTNIQYLMTAAAKLIRATPLAQSGADAVSATPDALEA